MAEQSSPGTGRMSTLHGLTVWRLSRFGKEWAVNATRWFYFTNHAYPGEHRYYIRLGRRPGWTRSFGRIVPPASSPGQETRL